MRFDPIPVVHDAFAVIDTYEKAYLVGFLLADGCVHLARPKLSSARINLRIKAEDIKVCRMIQGIAGGNLGLIENGYRVCWAVSSNRMAADLAALGITPRKSLTASLEWDAIPDHLHGAVLAGLIDGDGHMRIRRTRRKAEISMVTASEKLRDQLLERFPFFQVVTFTPSGMRKSTLYQLGVDSNRERLWALIRCAYAYLPFGILDRKKRVLFAIKDYLEEMDAYDARMEEVPRLKAQGMTLDEVAAAVGTSLRPVLARLKQAGIVSQQTVFDESDLSLMMRLHREGRTVLQIHSVVGKGTEQAVRYHLQKLGCIEKTTKQPTQHRRSVAILREHGKGKPAYQIAEELGICKRVVCRVLRDAGIALQKGVPKKLMPDQVVWAARQLEGGSTLKAAADELGVSSTLLRLRLRSMSDASKDADGSRET